MGASVARKLTCLGPRVLRHQLAQVCASCVMTCFSCAAIVFRYSKRARTFFTKYVPPEVTLLEIPPCQIPMCGVAYISCSYVLLTLGKYQNGTSYTCVSARHQWTRLVLFSTPWLNQRKDRRVEVRFVPLWTFAISRCKTRKFRRRALFNVFLHVSME